MAYPFISPNTGTSLKTQSADIKRTLWKRGVDMFEQTNDFFMPMEGAEGTDACIETITDLSKDRGSEIVFTQMAGFYQDPHMGEELFEESTHFEEAKINTYKLKVDWFRHATRYSARTKQHLGLGDEIISGLPEQLGKWMGRLKTEHMFMNFRLRGNAENQIYANAKASADSLVSADTLDMDNIVTLGTQLERLGGRPARVSKDKSNNVIHRAVAVATQEALYSLKLDADYRQALREGGTRGQENYIFSGGFVDIDGNIIRKYRAIDHDGWGAVGSPLNPKAYLGAAMTSATMSITGGGSATGAAKTRVKYFRWFPNYAYPFSPEITYSAGTDPFYVLIYNTTGVDAGKFGFYRVVTNNGSTLTIDLALASAIDGPTKRHTTVGNVTWGAGVWNGKTTTDHPIGSTVILANSYGVPIGTTLLLGACAARRGYGALRNHRSEQIHEGGFIKDVFATTIFGQEVTKDTDGRAPNYLQLTHAIKYAGIPTPVVT